MHREPALSRVAGSLSYVRCVYALLARRFTPSRTPDRYFEIKFTDGLGERDPEKSMIVRKIVSGGRSGVERAALDLAIQLGISHGGWVPHGRVVDDGRLASRYRLTETGSTDGPQSDEANLKMSDGLLLLARGALMGPATRMLTEAQARHHPYLLIDLDRHTRFQSSLLINSWLKSEHIEILCISGPTENEDQRIYRDTIECFRTAWWALMMVEPVQSSYPQTNRAGRPHTMDEAVARLLQELPLKDKVTIANMGADEIPGLKASLGRYVQKQFGLWEGNEDLMQSCRQAADHPQLADEEIAALIIDRLARELRKTHKLRVL